MTNVTIRQDFMPEHFIIQTPNIIIYYDKTSKYFMEFVFLEIAFQTVKLFDIFNS
jgi:hypothetical protein